MPTYSIPAGARPKQCAGCDADIYWVVTENNKRMPVNADGIPHWAAKMAWNSGLNEGVAIGHII